jgi:plastocyanin
MRFVQMGRRLLVRRHVAVIVLALTMVLSPTAPLPAHAATNWRAAVGAQTPDYSIQGLGFFPVEIFVNVGDSITWTWKANEIHTVTFLPPGQTPPAFQTAPTTPDPSTWDGMTFVNSGVKTTDDPHPTFTVNFATVGDFGYLCLVHPTTMTATVHVLAANVRVPHDQAFYDREAARQAQQILAKGRDARRAGLAAAQGGGPTAITAGGGAQTVFASGIQTAFVARFLPQVRRVHQGDTVTWTNPDAFTPHTITFGMAPNNNPTGLDRPGHATINTNPLNQTISSGLIGVGRPAGSQFSVTFTQEGRGVRVLLLAPLRPGDGWRNPRAATGRPGRRLTQTA